MSIKPVQNQFNGGEISPLMDARFDLPAYQYASSIMQNFIPISEGCYKRRGGTHFVASVKKSEAVLFKIVPDPDYATVTINGVVQNECYVAVGDLVNYSVSAENYQTLNGTYYVNDNTELNAVLVSAVERYNFSINPTPEDAFVLINGMERKSLLAAGNSQIDWSVSKDGYHTQSGTIRAIREDTTLDIALKLRFSIVANPAGATITINGENRDYIDVEPNTEVTWSVTKSGYIAKSGTEVITSSYTKVVELSRQAVGQVMFNSSAAGTYSLDLEAGEYDLLMCGAGGKGWDSDDIANRLGTGGSGAVFQGVIRLTEGVYTLKVGAANGGPGNGDTSFGGIVTAGGGTNAHGEGNKAGGILVVNSAAEIASVIISANGTTAKATHKNLAPLPDEYKNSYGWGGGYYRNYQKGGPGFIRLVYRG